MSVRRAALEDLDRIRAIAFAAYSGYVARIGRPPAPMVADFAARIERDAVYLLTSASEVAGFVVFYPRQGRMHLENIAIHPDYQNRGYGKDLLQFVESRAGADGFDEVELYTNAKMTENLAIYPRLGYVETHRLHEDGFDRVYFRKNLQSAE